MENSIEITCPSCGAAVTVRPEDVNISCPYCNASFVHDQNKEEKTSYDFENYFAEYYRGLDAKQKEGVDWLRKKDLLSSLSRFEESLKFILKKVGNNAMPHIRKLNFLQTLNLDSSPVTDKGLVHIVTLTDLKYLDLRRTRITGRGLQYVRGLKNLEELNLSGTKADDEGMGYLTGCIALRKLDLDSTDVTENGLIKLKDMPNLESVEIKDYNIKPGPVFRAGAARFLRGFLSLSFTGFDLTDEELEPVHMFHELSSLTLDGNKIQGSGMKYLTGLRNLKWVSLNNTPFTDEGLEVLGRCKNLASVLLINTKVTEKAVRNFEQKHPKTTLGTVFM
jgi:Leucine-rich repeat (LRR) protein